LASCCRTRCRANRWRRSNAMRKLTERIDASRNAGADGAALASVEHGLAELRDALARPCAGRQSTRG
jgi:hypothetical protein